MASVVANNINNNEIVDNNSSNLDVQLHNSKKFISMLQQTAWVLNNLIKNYNANYKDGNNNYLTIKLHSQDILFHFFNLL